MALDFPNTPTVGQNYTAAGATWQWDGTKWVAIGGAFPSGTVMSFFQASAPIGWTQVTTHNDKLLRVVNAAGGGSGGTNAFSTVNAQTVVGNHTLSAAELPSIGSSGSANFTVYPTGNNGYFFPMLANAGWGGSSITLGSGVSTNVANPANTGVTYTNNHSGSNSYSSNSTNTGGGAHNHSITMGIQYVDMIIASKN